MPLDLAEDRRRRVRRELQPALGIEPVDRLDQPDRADLDEIGHRLVAAGEPARQIVDQRHVQLDQLVAQSAAGAGRPPASSCNSREQLRRLGARDSPSRARVGGRHAAAASPRLVTVMVIRRVVAGDLDARWPARRARSRRSRRGRARSRPALRTDAVDRELPGTERETRRSSVASRRSACGSSSAHASSTASRRSSMSSTVRSHRAARLAVVSRSVDDVRRRRRAPGPRRRRRRRPSVVGLLGVGHRPSSRRGIAVDVPVRDHRRAVLGAEHATARPCPSSRCAPPLTGSPIQRAPSTRLMWPCADEHDRAVAAALRRAGEHPVGPRADLAAVSPSGHRRA